MTEYGSLGDISDEQLQAAASRFELGRVSRAGPLSGGLFGKNVALWTDTGVWVLRGAPWPPDSDEQFRRERFFARAIREQTEVPAPWPYLVESDGGIFGWPFALMPRLPGLVLDWKQDHDWPALATALGRAATSLHEITWHAVGEWAPGIDGFSPFSGTAAEWLEARTAARLFRIAADSEALDVDSEALVYSALAAATAVLTDDVRPTYVHHDLTIGNVVAQRRGGGYGISGVFDLGGGYGGDPLEDLARSLWQFSMARQDGSARAFLSACLDRPISPGEADRLRAYVIFDLLVMWEFGRREKMDWFRGATTFAGYAQPVLARVEEAIAATP